MPITADPVQNPMGALQALAAERLPGRMDMQDAQLQKLQQMSERNPAMEENERWAAMATAASRHPPMVGGFGQLLASIGGAYGQTLAAQERQALANQQALAKQMDSASLYRTLGAGRGATIGGTGKFVPVPGVPGLMTNNVTGERLDLRDAAAVKQVQDLFMKIRGDYATEEEALQAAFRALSGTGARPPQGVAPAAVATPGVDVDITPEGALTKQQTTSKWIEQLRRDEAEAVSRGDYARATEVKNARDALAQQLGGEAPKRKDVAAIKGREKTAEESAKMYADSFEEHVVKPATAFSNTGKIMQDFNHLSQAQNALKGGKFKEFMGGETGKWLLSIAPPGSDLSKGIANAQEAEKLTAGMVNQILMAAKGVQTEGDAQRARSQVTQIGTSEDANKYVEAYISETARQLQMRERIGNEHKRATGTYEGYDDAWRKSPIMTDARGSVKKLGNTWIGLTQYIDKFIAKNPGATEKDAVASWNKVK